MLFFLSADISQRNQQLRGVSILKFKKISISILSLMTLGFIATGCSSNGDDNSIIEGLKKVVSLDKARDVMNSELEETVGKHGGQSINDDSSNSGVIEDSSTYEHLSNLDFNSGSNIVYTVNGNESSLNIDDWAGPKIEYSNLDEINRTQSALAHLTKENYGASAGRSSQKWNPTGWNNQAKMIDGKKTYVHNRGHLIAYTISFNLDDDGKKVEGEDGSIDNPKNLFTQSAYSNQVTFQKYEEQVREAIKAGSNVLYKVQPVFRGDELMARGLWAQAISDDGSVNFNVYIFNVEPGLSYDYSSGKSSIDTSMKIFD